jgi:hypothetical protein
MGVEVISLDLSVPFTAARARNAGIARLRELAASVQFVQVVDGDCEIVDGWLQRARQELLEHEKVAVVCGRRRERFPDASPYNRLCDMEWNTPIGEAEACGGDALIRIQPFLQIGGYDDSIIAGEEPEMCLRVRQLGWKIHRIDAEMTLHDAQMVRFGQWWKRTVRSGHAYAEGFARHGRGAERFCRDQMRSIIEWGLMLPLIALGLAWFTWGLSLALFLGYALLFVRVRNWRLQIGDPAPHARLYAAYCVLGKFAQLVGAAQYWMNRLLGRRTRIIEYKGADVPPSIPGHAPEAGRS